MASLRQAWEAMRTRLAPPPLGRGSLVEIFGKPDCHLCEVAKARLHELQRQWGFELHEVNIAQDPRLQAEYGERIPVIRVNGELAGKFRIDEARLRRKLEQAAHAPGEE